MRYILVVIMVLVMASSVFAVADQTESIWVNGLDSKSANVSGTYTDIDEISAIFEWDYVYFGSTEIGQRDSISVTFSNLVDVSAISGVDSIKLEGIFAEDGTFGATLNLEIDTNGSWSTADNNISLNGVTPVTKSVLLTSSGLTTTRVNNLKLLMWSATQEGIYIYGAYIQVFHTRTISAPSLSWSTTVPDTMRGLTYQRLYITATPGSSNVDSLLAYIKETGSSYWLLVGGRGGYRDYAEYTASGSNDYIATVAEGSDVINIPFFLENYNEACSLRVCTYTKDGGADTLKDSVMVVSSDEVLIDSVREDTHISEGDPGSNFGTAGSVTIDLSSSIGNNDDDRGWYLIASGIHSPMSGYDSLVYYLRIKMTITNDCIFYIRALGETSAETQVTWNNRLTGTGWTDSGGTFLAPGSGGYCDTIAFGDSSTSQRSVQYIPVRYTADSIYILIGAIGANASQTVASYEAGIGGIYVPVLFGSGTTYTGLTSRRRKLDGGK